MKAINFRVPLSLYERIKKTSAEGLGTDGTAKEQRKSISLSRCYRMRSLPLLAQIIEDALVNNKDGGNE